MNTFTVPLLVVLLVTSQYLHAYPAGSAMETMKNPRLKREYGYLQRHELPNNLNEDLPFNWDDNLPLIYSIIPRTNHKRLIDF